MPGIPLKYGSFVLAPDARDPVAEGEFRLRIPAAALFGRSGREPAGADGSLSEDLREVLALHVDLERGRLDLPRVIDGGPASAAPGKFSAAWGSASRSRTSSSRRPGNWRLPVG